MSVIAAKVYNDRIEIASDSQVTYDKFKRTTTGESLKKLFKIQYSPDDCLIVGITGSTDGCCLFREFCNIKGAPEKAEILSIINFLKEFRDWRTEIAGETDEELFSIIVFQNKAFLIEGFSVSEIHTYSASGSGMEYAFVALDCGVSPEEAVQAAINHNTYCCGPIISYTYEKK